MISVKVSLPKVEFAKRGWLNAIASKQRAKSLPKLRELFKKTVFGWSKKPDFGWAQTVRSDEITINVYPRGEGADIWNLVNAGSPPHRIPKTGFTRMVYRPGYKAATRPGSLQSSRKYRSGRPRVAYSINHPGFEARNFTEQIAQTYASEFAMDMQEAVTEVARRKM